MLDKSCSVALVLPTQQEITTFSAALGASGFRRITAFTSAKEAYEVCTRQQFPLFVTRMEIPDMNGIVLIQKLRETGNYGQEVHLFVCDKIDATMVNSLYELELPYVLAKPFTKEAIQQKFEHLLKTENGLSPLEQQYRDARAAFYNNDLIDMAEDLVKQVLKAQPAMDRALALLGDIHMRKGQPAEARQHYVAALKSNPKSASAAHKLAQTYMSEGNYQQASDMLNKLAALNPFNIKLLENAGLSNFECEQYDKAKEFMGKVTALDATNKTAVSVTTQIKISEGDYTGIVAAMRKSHDEKEIVQFLNNAGVKLSQGDDVEGALKMYAACAEQLTESKFLYAIFYNMGLAYKKLGDIAKAKACLSKSLKLNPQFEKAAKSIKEWEKEAA